MKPKHLIILVLFAALNSKSHCQWSDQKSGVSVNLIDVSFVDPMNGCIIGEESTILTTNDGGTKWIKRQSPINDINFTKVQLVNQNNGFIVGENGLILKTVDGGINWTALNSLYYNYSDISFVDSMNGWLSCWKETPSEKIGAILHTSDGGNNWEIQLEKISETLDLSIVFMAIEFFNENIGWALGGNYLGSSDSDTYIYHTRDGGNNWEVIGFVYTRQIYELNIADENTLWASKWTHLISANGGSDWSFYPEQNVHAMGAASPINSKSGWIFMYRRFESTNKILFTNNFGKTWIEELDIQNGLIVNSMTNINGKYLWIVGEDGIIKHKRGTTTDIGNNDVQVEKFDLFQNYPNPFNPTTKISYQIPAVGNENVRSVQLTVYDILGNEVAELVNENKNAGYHEVEFKADNLSSGVYFYQLQMGNFIRSKKMILLR